MVENCSGMWNSLTELNQKFGIFNVISHNLKL